jgi:hypothetical protein
MGARKSKPKPDDKEQSKRFIDKAEEIQSDDAENAFEKALKKIIKKNKCSSKT